MPDVNPSSKFAPPFCALIFPRFRVLKDYPRKLDLSPFGLEGVDLDEKFPIGVEFPMMQQEDWSLNQV